MNPITIVDTRGQQCPKPLILTKKALSECQIGKTLKILIDNETSKINVERFLKDNGLRVSTQKKSGIFELSLVKDNDLMPFQETESMCTPPEETKPGYVIAIKTNQMGIGNEELGKILIQGFINTIRELTPLPSKIIFYNSGIHLATENSPVENSLKELESKRIEILVCGTCLNFFKKKDNLVAGKISNMYEIMESLQKASHVIYP